MSSIYELLEYCCSWFAVGITWNAPWLSLACQRGGEKAVVQIIYKNTRLSLHIMAADNITEYSYDVVNTFIATRISYVVNLQLFVTKCNECNSMSSWKIPAMVPGSTKARAGTY